MVLLRSTYLYVYNRAECNDGPDNASLSEKARRPCLVLLLVLLCKEIKNKENGMPPIVILFLFILSIDHKMIDIDFKIILINLM